MRGIGSVGRVLAGKYATYGDSDNRNTEPQQQTATTNRNSKQPEHGDHGSALKQHR
jgi:hypothetical protein